MHAKIQNVPFCHWKAQILVSGRSKIFRKNSGSILLPNHLSSRPKETESLSMKCWSTLLRFFFFSLNYEGRSLIISHFEIVIVILEQKLEKSFQKSQMIKIQQNLVGSDWCVQKFITHLEIAYIEVHCYVVKCQNGKKIVSHEVSTI